MSVLLIFGKGSSPSFLSSYLFHLKISLIPENLVCLFETQEEYLPGICLILSITYS